MNAGLRAVRLSPLSPGNGWVPVGTGSACDWECKVQGQRPRPHLGFMGVGGGKQGVGDGLRGPAFPDWMSGEQKLPEMEGTFQNAHLEGRYVMPAALSVFWFVRGTGSCHQSLEKHLLGACCV